MKGRQFAKLFDTKHGQLLVFIQPRDEVHEMVFKMDFDSQDATMTYGYDSNESLNENFEKVNDELAEEASEAIVNNIIIHE